MLPRASLPKTSMARSMDKVLANTQLIEQLKVIAQDSTFFDHQSPAVRYRRKTTRENFEYFVSTLYGVNSTEAIWNDDTIIDRCKIFIGAIPQWAHGKLHTVVKTCSLWHAKDALYWWAVRLIPRFPIMHARWHQELVAHIHLTAITFSLSTESYEKNNLTESELTMFYEAIANMYGDTRNWKQHCIAWSLVWCTAVRPGSITVCKGYEKGASQGTSNGESKRKEDETLRWRDITWVRYPHGIGANITYHYLKGHRNPYTQKLVEGNKG